MIDITANVHEAFPEFCVPILAVETWLNHPPVAGDRVLMLGRGVALELYAISGSFTFDKRDGTLGILKQYIYT